MGFVAVVIGIGILVLVIAIMKKKDPEALDRAYEEIERKEQIKELQKLRLSDQELRNVLNRVDNAKRTNDVWRDRN